MHITVLHFTIMIYYVFLCLSYVFTHVYTWGILHRHPKFEVPRAVLLRIHGLVCMTPEQKNAAVHGVIITFSVCRLLIGSVRLLGQGLNPTKICLKMGVLPRK